VNGAHGKGTSGAKASGQVRPHLECVQGFVAFSQETGAKSAQAQIWKAGLPMKKAALALALSALALTAFATIGEANDRRGKPQVATAAGFQPTGARYVRKRALAPRGYRRIGFYSYTYRDVINTYGMSRARYGSINTYRDPFVDRQTVNGPFDHGFFFDSAIGPRGGDSPYLH
jgi:hypothetical protein